MKNGSRCSQWAFPLLLALVLVILNIPANTGPSVDAILSPFAMGTNCSTGAQHGTRQGEYRPLLECKDNRTKTAEPLDPILFNFTVKNGGDVPDDYDVLCSQITGWNIIPSISEFHDVQPLSGPASDEEKTRNLTVAVIVGNVSTARVGLYEINVTLRSRGDPSNETGIGVFTDVLLLHRIGLLAPESREAMPGDRIIYDFEVVNDGNGDDEYRLWTGSSDNNWHTELVDADDGNISVPFGGLKKVEVMLYVPDYTDAGSSQLTTLYARPKDTGDPVEPVSEFVQTSVKTSYDIDPEQEEGELVKEGAPGDSVTFNFTVTNAGNGLDSVIGSEGTFRMVKVPQIPSPWNVSVDTSGIRQGGLPKGHEAAIVLTVTIPYVTPAGDYVLGMDIFTGLSLAYQGELSFTTRVRAKYGVVVGCADCRKNSSSGENVSFALTVWNSGNLPDSYDFEMSSDNPEWLYVPVRQVYLDFGDDTTVRFFMEVPEHAPPGKYGFALKCLSEGMGGEICEQTFELTVIRSLSFTLDPSAVNLRAVPGMERLLLIEARNTGNVEVLLSLEVDGESWCGLERASLHLGVASSACTSLVFRPPFEVYAREYDFVLTATAVQAPEMNASCRIHLDMNDSTGDGDFFRLTFKGEGSELYVGDGGVSVIHEEPLGGAGLGGSWKTCYVIGAARLDLTVKAGNGITRGAVAGGRYTLNITKVGPDGRSGIILQEMELAEPGEEHRYALYWPSDTTGDGDAGAYDLSISCHSRDRDFRLDAADMPVALGENDTIYLSCDGDVFDLNITKKKAGGAELVVRLRKIPMGGADSITLTVDWHEVANGGDDSISLSYVDEFGGMIRQVTLRAEAEGIPAAGDVGTSFISMRTLVTSVGVLVVLTVVIGFVVSRGNARRKRHLMTRYSVLGYIKFHEGGVTPEDIGKGLDALRDRMRVRQRNIDECLNALTREDKVYRKTAEGTEYYYLRCENGNIHDVRE